MEETTSGLGTSDWLRATQGLTILAFVPGDHSAQSTVGISARRQEDGSQVIVQSAPADATLSRGDAVSCSKGEATE